MWWITKKVSYLGRRDGWLCADCNWLECDRCDEKIYDDCTPYDVYQGHDESRFMMVHESTTNV